MTDTTAVALDAPARPPWRIRMIDRIDGFLFVFAGVAAVWLALLLFQESIRFGWQTLMLIAFWIVFTYLLLPRLHRILTRLYVPGYFIGRTRTSDGLLGDPVNLALLGHEAQLHAAMTAAGWTRADDLAARSAGRIVASTLSRRSYPQAPVSPLLLFDRQQDFAYQQEVEGSPSRRHHVRFWRCPPGWLLPGGFAADWLAAGTYDRSVGLSLFTLQITHKIEQNTDIERDFIVASITAACTEVEVQVIDNFSTGYHARNGGGDLIRTDGDLPVVDLRSVDVVPLPILDLTDSRDTRPAQISFGVWASILRAGFYLLVAGFFVVAPGVETLLDSEGGELGAADRTILRYVVAATLLVLAATDVTLGLLTRAGSNTARLLLMGSSVFATVSAFLSAVGSGEEVRVGTNLPTVAVSILVLLALSSHRARDYAVRGRHRPRRLSRRTQRTWLGSAPP